MTQGVQIDEHFPFVGARRSQKMFIFLLTLRWEWKNADCSKNGWCDFPNAITNSENSQTSPKPKHAWLPNSVTMVNNCWESALQSRATRFQVDFMTKIIWLGWWYLWLGCNNIFLRFRINLRINKVNCKALKITKRQRDQGIFPNKWKQKKNLGLPWRKNLWSFPLFCSYC